MSFFELFLIAVSLSMDAFAVAVCTGLSIKKIKFHQTLSVGLYFGVFQALMPLIGFFVGSRFVKYIESFDHWVVFALLAVIGINMIKESRGKEEKDENSYSLKPAKMLVLALATSIDALAVGISFALMNVNIYSTVALIGCTTLVISMLGVRIGKSFGSKYKSPAELCGGVILILIGLKVLVEHLLK